MAVIWSHITSQSKRHFHEIRTFFTNETTSTFGQFICKFISVADNCLQSHCYLLKSPLFDNFHAIRIMRSSRIIQISRWFFYQPVQKMVNHKRKMLLHSHDLMLLFPSFACRFLCSFFSLQSNKSSKKYESDGWEGKKTTKERKQEWWRKALRKFD